ncbi:MAG TPA: wax ester/triacylglycerol synthase domain-containing protein [Acidimicrobiales bacterium]
MRESDALTWRMEADPVLRSTIVSVAWLDGAPDWDRLLERLDRATRSASSFRMVVVEPPARLATPRWVPAPAFDLSWHLRRVDAPEPRTAATVVDMARTAAMTAFDPARPLWEFTVVGNLVGGRAALVMKVHHALTDGVGGMELAPLLFDMDAAAGSIDAMPADRAGEPSGERVGGLGLVRESLAHQAGRVLRTARNAAAAAPAAAVRAARHPAGAAGDVIATAASIGRTVAPVTTALSPVMTARSLGRRLDMMTVPLAGLKAAAAGRGTVNAAYLTAVTGGLARYHEAHGAPVGELRVTLPISIRTPDDPIGGNRITLQRFRLPAGTGRTAERLSAVGRRAEAVRRERSLPHTDAIAGGLNVLPAGVVGEILKHVDFVASNVPAFPWPVHLAGARVAALHAWGPTIGAALNVTLVSYAGTCWVGLNTDTAAVADPETLAACLADGFEEVLALGGDHDPVVRPLAEGRFPGEPAKQRRRTT